jgi:hypothetical protein
VVKGFRKKEVERPAERDFAAGSTVAIDGLSCWPTVEKAGCAHFPMASGSGKRAATWAPFQWVNTCLGNTVTCPFVRQGGSGGNQAAVPAPIGVVRPSGQREA